MKVQPSPLGKLKECLLSVLPNEAQWGSQLKLDGQINFRFADFEPIPIRMWQFIGMAPEMATSFFYQEVEHLRRLSGS